jgi:hypothetical protein
MVVRLPRPANSFFTAPIFQFHALRGSFELVEKGLPELVKQRGFPGWDGDPATSVEALKSQMYQNVVDQIMPQAYRGAVLVALWGLYEYTVVLVCDTIRRLDREMAPIPRGNNWLRQMKRYFRREVGFPLFPSNPPAFEEELKALQKIRHVFMHANGMKQTTKEEDWIFLQRYSESHPSSLDLNRNYVDVSADFLRGRFDLVAEAIKHVVGKSRDRLEQLGIPDEGLPEAQPYHGKLFNWRRWITYVRSFMRCQALASFLAGVVKIKQGLPPPHELYPHACDHLLV